MLTVVIGPPAAGKSTWVQENAKAGDVVIDFDRIAVALTGPGGDPHDHAPPVAAVARAARTAAVEAALKHATTCDVYVIHSSPGAERMARYQALGARLVTVDPGRDVVRAQARGQRPQRIYAAIDEWYRQHAQRPAVVPKRAAPPVHSFPEVASRSW
jgi:hypothetical protein